MTKNSNNSDKPVEESADNQVKKSNRGRKKAPEFYGFTLHHERMIRLLILIYEEECKGKYLDVAIISLIRFLYKMKILKKDRGGKQIPLVLSTIRTETYTEWELIKAERKAGEHAIHP